MNYSDKDEKILKDLKDLAPIRERAMALHKQAIELLASDEPKMALAYMKESADLWEEYGKAYSMIVHLESLKDKEVLN